jgi:hypothetical protein
MRPAATLPFALAAIVLAGCDAEVPSTASVQRDLTLQSPATPMAQVASPVELSRQTPEVTGRPAGPRKQAKPAAAPTPEPVPAVPPAAAEPAPAPVSVVAEVAAEEAPIEDAAVGAGRELAPGTTVTAIPVSSGPSYTPEADDSWLPTGPARGIVVGGGDTCRRRGGGRGIGIAGRIPGGVPRHRLR